MYRGIPIIACLLISLGSIGAQECKFLNLYQAQWITEIVPQDSVIQLPHRFLIPGSEKFFIGNKQLQPRQDYQIDYQQGQIFLRSQQGTLKVFYQYLPLGVKPRYFLWEANKEKEKIPKSQTSRIQLRSKTVPEPPSETKLLKSGSITRSLILGTNQGLRLDSGLRLQLTGNITPEVEIIAALTDQNTPIEPEGNTQTLQEIDKVYIQINAPKVQATLGDFNIIYGGTRFAQYQRKLQGAMIKGQLPLLDFTVSGAVSKGKFTTNKFLGQEGKQGPYQLHGPNGELNIIVLAGTEKVWVDGELMTRGEENDYVIEYGNGQITFTRHRLITGDSRIVVDFEYSDLRFQRNLFSASGNAGFWNNKLRLGATLIREADDKDNPLETPLSEEEIHKLEKLGDHPDSAFVDGGKYVGGGKGSYVQVDSGGVKFYRYVGANQGDYLVKFSYVGQANGDYRYMGGGRYVFVGPGEGNYQARRYLSLPQTHNLVDVTLQFSPHENFVIIAESAVSQFDQNIFSGLDDSDNRGSAYQLQLQLKSTPLRLLDRNWGRFGVSATLRSQAERFRPIGRTYEVEYARKWDLAEANSNGELTKEVNLQYAPWSWAQGRFGYGYIEKGNWFNSRRWNADIELKPSNWPHLHYFREQISSENHNQNLRSNWLRQQGQVSYEFWYLRPSIRYEGEIKKGSVKKDSTIVGFRFDELVGELATRKLDPFRASINWNYRQDDSMLQQKFHRQSLARGWGTEFALDQWHNFTASLELKRRVRQYFQSTQPNKETRLSDFKLFYFPWKGALKTELRYQVSNTQISRREKLYLKVEKGQGNYRYDPLLEEYVPDPYGDYVLRTFATGDYEPATDILLNFRLRLQPRQHWITTDNKKLSWWQRVLQNLSTETCLRLDEKTKRSNPWKLSTYNPKSLFPDNLTIYGRYELRQDILFFENVLNRSLRLRWQQSYELNNRYLEGRQSVFRREQSLRYFHRFSSEFGGKFSYQFRRVRKEYHVFDRNNRNIFSHAVQFELSYRPKSLLEFALAAKLIADSNREPNPPTKACLLSLVPRITYGLRKSARLRAELDFSNVTVAPRSRVLPYEMVEGKHAGRSLYWRLSGDYRMSSRLMFMISYSGRYQPKGLVGYGSRVMHIGRAEVKAFF